MRHSLLVVPPHLPDASFPTRHRNHMLRWKSFRHSSLKLALLLNRCWCYLVYNVLITSASLSSFFLSSPRLPSPFLSLVSFAVMIIILTETLSSSYHTSTTCACAFYHHAHWLTGVLVIIGSIHHWYYRDGPTSTYTRVQSIHYHEGNHGHVNDT